MINISRRKDTKGSRDGIVSLLTLHIPLKPSRVQLTVSKIASKGSNSRGQFYPSNSEGEETAHPSTFDCSTNLRKLSSKLIPDIWQAPKPRSTGTNVFLLVESPRSYRSYRIHYVFTTKALFRDCILHYGRLCNLRRQIFLFVRIIFSCMIFQVSSSVPRSCALLCSFFTSPLILALASFSLGAMSVQREASIRSSRD